MITYLTCEECFQTLERQKVLSLSDEEFDEEYFICLACIDNLHSDALKSFFLDFKKRENL